MGINKFNYFGSDVFNITDSTVTESSLEKGKVAYDSKGDRITGSLEFVTFHVGTSTPANSFGNDGDLFLKVVQ